MRYWVSAAATAACLAFGCSPQVEAASSTGNTGDMVVQMKTKDGKDFDIHLPPPNGKPRDVKGVEDLFQTFTAFCLEAFPDDTAVAAKIKAGAHEALSSDDLADLLHGDAGQGWVVRLNHSAITLTLQSQPSHACGARAFLPIEPDIGLTAATYIGLWGFTQSPPETLLPGPVTRGATATQTMQTFILAGPDKRPVEQIAAYFTHEPDSAQVQLRLVRMRGNNLH
jgi:hypothetical protein